MEQVEKLAPDESSVKAARKLALPRPWHETGSTDNGCVMCKIVAATDDAAALVLERTENTIVVMNLYPYGSGHLLVAPTRHAASFEDLETALRAMGRKRGESLVVEVGAELPEYVNIFF